MNATTPSSFKTMWCCLFLFLTLQLISHSWATPVIGILTEPIFTTENVTEYMIAASYTKWLEVGGARSIPIPYDATQGQVEEIFPHINGVLFPGGGGKALSPSARHIWHLANLENANPRGFFPIWGTCLGFEYLVMLVSGQDDILEGGFDAENISLPLILQPSSSASPSAIPSRLYRGMRHMVSTSNITLNNHQFGISPQSFAQNHNLSSLFDITSINHDRKGNYFVSTIEPKDPEKNPYYGVQYHPEKNAFEYATYSKTNIPFEAIDHSREGLFLSTRLASFFVNLTRVNEQARSSSFAVPPMSDYYPDVYTYPRRVGISFQEYYVIPSADEIVVSMQ